jgi:predicted permease
MLATLQYDSRLAVRTLLSRPGFTLAAVATLGLGIGANAMIFSVVNAVLFTPLPYPESHRLVNAFRVDPEVTGRNPNLSSLGGLYAVPHPVFLDWAELSPVFESAGAYRGTGQTVTGGDQPERISATEVSSGVFAALLARPMLGRLFGTADDQIEAPRVAILSHGTWQTRYGSDPDVVGRTIGLSGVTHEIVGVMPPGFHFRDGDESLWTILDDGIKQQTSRNAGNLQVIARLSPGVTLEQAQREMDAVARHIGELHPAEVEHGIGLVERRELVVAESRSGLYLLLGAVGLVLVIACANIANLLLVRATERRRELGVRQALGAGRGRLLMQSLSESVMLSVAGGVAGCAIAIFTLRPFTAAFPGGLPRATEIAVDYRLLLFAAGLAVATGVVIGLLPAIRSIRTPIVEVLQDGGRGHAGGRRRNRTHAALVVAEVALAFVLLAGTGLFIRSLQRLTAVDPGLNAQDLLISSVNLPSQYRDFGDTTRALFRDLDQRLATIPGVQDFARASQMPFVGGWSSPPTVVETPDGITETIIHRASITPGYLSTMGIPLLAGRGFTTEDTEDAPAAIVINRAMAERYWPGVDPIGRRVMVPVPGDSIWRTVVGVAGDVLYRLNFRPFPKYYVPFAQIPYWYQFVIVKSTLGPEAVAPAIRQAVWLLDSDLPVSVFRLEEAINGSDAVTGPRFAIIMFGCLSALAALLAIIGIYGVLAYAVQQHSNEIGIRMALGAGATDVLRSVLRRGLAMAGIGLAVGLGLALAGSRVIRSLLFEVSPADPITLASVALFITVATLIASYMPARKATKVDPVRTLRE